MSAEGYMDASLCTDCGPMTTILREKDNTFVSYVNEAISIYWAMILFSTGQLQDLYFNKAASSRGKNGMGTMRQ